MKILSYENLGNYSDCFDFFGLVGINIAIEKSFINYVNPINAIFIIIEFDNDTDTIDFEYCYN